MSEVAGKTKYYEMWGTLDINDEIETEIIEHPEEICEAYKSGWNIDEDGDIVVHFAYKARRNGFWKFSEEIDVDRYLELIGDMELIE